MRVRLAGPGRLIARDVPQAEQLPVELGQAPRVGGVQDGLPDDRERLLIVHTATLGMGGPSRFHFAFTALPPRLSGLMGLPQTEGGGDGAAGGQ